MFRHFFQPLVFYTIQSNFSSYNTYHVYLYVLYVSKDIKLEPIDTNEIGDIKWVHLNDVDKITNKANLLTKVMNYIMSQEL